ncbi:MAG: hypothetical protein WBE74_24700, partial [Terracidiphilus sp.]
MTNAVPPQRPAETAASSSTAAQPALKFDQLPDDPSQEMIPVAQPQPAPPAGEPIRWTANEQKREGDVWTLNGNVAIYYENYTLHADK